MAHNVDIMICFLLLKTFLFLSKNEKYLHCMFYRLRQPFCTIDLDMPQHIKAYSTKTHCCQLLYSHTTQLTLLSEVS